MIFIECRQGTQEWLAARAGVCTASRFSDAISTVGGLNEQQAKFVKLVLSGADEKSAATEAGYKAVPRSDIIARALLGDSTVVPSDISNRYAIDIAIERISQKPYGEPPKTWLLDRGHELEDMARMAYEVKTGYLAEEVGIVLTDDRLFGYSTDGMPDDGLIEIKCPIDSQKIYAMWKTGDVSEYMHQMQGGMWITGRKWCDFIMYCPDLASIGKDLFIKRILRDDNFIDAMVEKLVAFNRRADEFRKFFGTSQITKQDAPKPTPKATEPALALESIDF